MKNLFRKLLKSGPHYSHGITGALLGYYQGDERLFCTQRYCAGITKGLIGGVQWTGHAWPQWKEQAKDLFALTRERTALGPRPRLTLC